MAEQIVNEFTVNRPIGEAWPIVCDLERIAPCLPGAQLEEIEGDIHRGKVKVKLGAVATEFKGEAHFTERDDEAHHAKIHATGRDTKGRGNASADISADAEALSPTATKVVVVADVHITGKVAQFGRGIMQDVSKKLIDQFATNLDEMIDADGVAPDQPVDTAGGSAGEAADQTGEDGAEQTGATSGDEVRDATDPRPADEPTIRRIDGPAAEPVDLTDMAGPALLKRIGPAVVALLILLLVLRRRK